MKKATAIALSLLLLILLLSGCGAGSKYDTMASAGSNGNSSYIASDGYFQESMADADPSSPAAYGYSGAAAGLSEKIIYSASADIETVEFDDTLDAVYGMLDEYGAFLENSYVSGVNYRDSYYGRSGYRNADFTIRVPSEKFISITDGLSALGNVVYLTTDTKNITTQFYDLEARLRTYETEEERLLSMLEAADNVSDMIMIEERLSDVRYNIESAQTTLNSWQTEVDYSTLELHISEVEKLSENPETHMTYGEEISKGFVKTLSSIGDFFKDLFKSFVVSLPVLIIVAAAIAIVVVIALRVRKKRRTGSKDRDSGAK